jgi:serine O-acetyltransferase
MPTVLKELLLFLSIIRLVPHIVLMLLSSNRDLIFADLDRWNQFRRLGKSHNLIGRLILFSEFMTFWPEYRTAFCLRTGLPGLLLSAFCRRMPTLSIKAKSIGAGFFINHGHGTYVSAEDIGENCSISQLVTIGYYDGAGPPSIGNNVIVHVGATIIGKLRIGDNSIIGANSLVLTDVPPNVTVMGVPARILWTGDTMKTEKAEDA